MAPLRRTQRPYAARTRLRAVPLPARGAGHMITMEKSPSYAMYYCKTAERLRTALPSVKMITLLRDPVERTYSSFYHHCRHHGRLKVRQTALPSPRARVASCAPPPLPRRHRVSVAASRLTGRRADAADAHQHMAGPRVWAGQAG